MSDSRLGTLRGRDISDEWLPRWSGTFSLKSMATGNMFDDWIIRAMMLKP